MDVVLVIVLILWNHITFISDGRARGALWAKVALLTPGSWLAMGPWESWVTSATWNRDRPPN